MTPSPLVLTPRQAAERLGVRLPTLRKHAATWEALTGEPLPRGEHLERLWPEPVVELLGEALGRVHRQEAASVAEALGALYRPDMPLPAPLPETGEALRALIREEVRFVVREEVGAALGSRPGREPLTVVGAEALREVIRQEMRLALDPDRIRIVLHAAAPPPGVKRASLRAMLLRWLRID